MEPRRDRTCDPATITYDSGWLCSWLTDSLFGEFFESQTACAGTGGPGSRACHPGSQRLPDADELPVLLHLLLRAQKLATCATITVDFRDASHLDESVLSYLQQVALPADHAFGEHVEVHHELGVAAASALEDADDFQLTLLEPSELPVCPIHGGESDHYGETDAESALAAMPLAGIISPQSLPCGKLAGLVEAGSAR